MGDRRLQVCYVLVTDGWDRHAQMMWLSARSLRMHEPDARITLVTDHLSRPKIDRIGRQLLDVVDQVVTVTSPVESPKLRAFHLKTILRRHVTGDLLYLDTDTLVIKKVADVLDIDAEVAAATDFNFVGPWFPPQLREPYTKLGWPYPLEYYFNSGVMLLRDTPAVHAFSEEWTRRWHLLVDEGMPGDQEAFVSALYAMPVKWCRLPPSFNAITVKRNYRFRQTRVLHFFGSEEEQRGTVMAHLLAHLRDTGAFDEQAYRRCLRQRHPWGPGYEPWQLWRSRNYLRAVALKAWRSAVAAFDRR